MEKKGEITDIIGFIIIVFFLAVSMIASGIVLQKLKYVVQVTPLNSTDVGQQVIAAYDVITFQTIPNSYLAMFALLIVSQIITSFLVKYHPVFIVLFIIFAAVGIFASFIIQNAYSMFVNANGIVEIAEQMTRINWLWSHITIIMCAVSAITLIVLFARLPGQGNQL